MFIGKGTISYKLLDRAGFEEAVIARVTEAFGQSTGLEIMLDIFETCESLEYWLDIFFPEGQEAADIADPLRRLFGESGEKNGGLSYRVDLNEDPGQVPLLVSLFGPFLAFQIGSDEEPFRVIYSDEQCVEPR